MSAKPSITFCSGVGTVTGANFLYQTSQEKNILIDCGLIQGQRFDEEINRQPFPYQPSTIQALIVTHAHLDHVGRIPKLVREGFKGKIFSTPQTRALAELVLNDAVKILADEAQEEKQPPLFTQEDVKAVFPLWQTFPYHVKFNPTDDSQAQFKDAGHILGSAMIEISEQQYCLLFTGDLGNSPAPLLCDTEKIGDVDYLIMESVYGDRNHESPEQRSADFERIIQESIKRAGTLVIPAFAVDRTQIILYELNNMVEEGLIPSVPIFVDSPMAIKATEIYAQNTDIFNIHARAQIARGDDIFKFPNLQFSYSQDQSRDIAKVSGAKIILAGSGMSVGGRIVSHEETYLQDEKNTILLMGYQTIGSLGRHLAEGAKKVHINNQKIKVKARIEKIYGFSAHKDSDNLVEFVSTATNRLKRVYVTMGELKGSMNLSQRLNNELGLEALIPNLSQKYFV